jgi:hypothetical protein
MPTLKFHTPNPHTTMPNKLNAYIDPAKIQGAYRMKLKNKAGEAEDCLVIVLSKSRIKVSDKNLERLGLSIDLVPNKEGKDDFGNTHWVKESTTKAERESAHPPNLPFLGNAKEYEPGGLRTARPAGGAPVSGGEDGGEDGGGLSEGMEDDDIPF